MAAKAATAAELVTQYNLAQLHAAYNELNRNRVAAAAAAQAMADHRASALQQAAAMTAAAVENSPPRYVQITALLGDHIGFNTGNVKKLSYRKAAALAWLCLAVTLHFRC